MKSRSHFLYCLLVRSIFASNLFVVSLHFAATLIGRAFVASMAFLNLVAIVDRLTASVKKRRNEQKGMVALIFELCGQERFLGVCFHFEVLSA